MKITRDSKDDFDTYKYGSFHNDIMILGMHTNTFKAISDNRFLPVSYMTQEFRT